MAAASLKPPPLNLLSQRYDAEIEAITQNHNVHRFAWSF